MKKFIVKITPKHDVERIEVKEGEDAYDVIQRALSGGYVEEVDIKTPIESVAGFVDEEGKLKRLPITATIKNYRDYLVGNVIFAKIDGEFIVGMSEEETNLIIQFIKNKIKYKHQELAFEGKEPL